MRVLNPAVDASRRPFTRMPAALTEAAESVPAVTVRADAVLAVRRSRLALPAVTVPVAATEPAVTAPVDAIFAARSAPFTVSDPLDTTPAKEAVSALITPAASTVPATRTACPTVRSPLTAISPPASRSPTQREACGGEPAGAGDGVAAHVEIGLHPVGLREARHSEPLEPAAVDGLVIEAAQRRQRTHGRGAAKGRLEGTHVMIDGGSGQPGRGIGWDQAEACLAGRLQQGGLKGCTVSPAPTASVAMTSITSAPAARISTR